MDWNEDSLKATVTINYNKFVYLSSSIPFHLHLYTVLSP